MKEQFRILSCRVMLSSCRIQAFCTLRSWMHMGLSVQRNPMRSECSIEDFLTEHRDCSEWIITANNAKRHAIVEKSSKSKSLPRPSNLDSNDDADIEMAVHPSRNLRLLKIFMKTLRMAGRGSTLVENPIENATRPPHPPLC
jgi:hypothetical protein